MKKMPCFYFSFRSPYSWIGAHRLVSQISPEKFEIEYVPFWEPGKRLLRTLREEKGGDFLYTPMSHQKHLYILQDIKRIVSKYDYQMAWPVDQREPNWDIPHLAYLTAVKLGKGKQFLWSVYRSRWEKGENICSEETLKYIADDLGIDSNKICMAHEDELVRNEGVEILYRIYKEGIFGVPFFTNGYEKFWGIDRLDDFIASLTI